jgi:hypothetical protein
VTLVLLVCASCCFAIDFPSFFLLCHLFHSLVPNVVIFVGDLLWRAFMLITVCGEMCGLIWYRCYRYSQLIYFLNQMIFEYGRNGRGPSHISNLRVNGFSIFVNTKCVGSTKTRIVLLFLCIIPFDRVEFHSVFSCGMVAWCGFFLGSQTHLFEGY